MKIFYTAKAAPLLFSLVLYAIVFTTRRRRSKSLESSQSQEARVALGYRLVQLLRFFWAQQSAACIHNSMVARSMITISRMKYFGQIYIGRADSKAFCGAFTVIYLKNCLSCELYLFRKQKIRALIGLKPSLCNSIKTQNSLTK